MNCAFFERAPGVNLSFFSGSSQNSCEGDPSQLRFSEEKGRWQSDRIIVSSALDMYMLDKLIEPSCTMRLVVGLIFPIKSRKMSFAKPYIYRLGRTP